MLQIRQIILAILLAVVVWSIAFLAGFWPRFHPSLSLLISILGAIVVLVILLLAKKLVGQNVFYVIIGSLIGLLLVQVVIPPGCIPISVDCSKQPPPATPDMAYAYTGDVICWLSGSVGYTVDFKQSNVIYPPNGGRRSPVRNLLGTGQEITIRVVTTQSRTVDVYQGEYSYNITCDNGNHVDPKVKVPPRP